MDIVSIDKVTHREGRETPRRRRVVLEEFLPLKGRGSAKRDASTAWADGFAEVAAAASGAATEAVEHIREASEDSLTAGRGVAGLGAREDALAVQPEGCGVDAAHDTPSVHADDLGVDAHPRVLKAGDEVPDLALGYARDHVVAQAIKALADGAHRRGLDLTGDVRIQRKRMAHELKRLGARGA